MRLTFPALFLIAVFGPWVYFGFPSLGTLLSLFSAKEQCARFATEYREKIFSAEKDAEIKSVRMWLKNDKLLSRLLRKSLARKDTTPGFVL